MYLIVLVNVYHYPLGIYAFFCTLAWLYIHVCDCACQKVFLRYASNLMDTSICIEYVNALMLFHT